MAGVSQDGGRTSKTKGAGTKRNGKRSSVEDEDNSATKAKKPRLKRDKELNKECERRRRGKLNIAFNKLEQLLPSYDPSKAMAKIKVIEGSTELIRNLQLSNSRLSTQDSKQDEKSKIISRLKDELDRILLRVQQLTNLLKDSNVVIPDGPLTKPLNKHCLCSKCSCEDSESENQDLLAKNGSKEPDSTNTISKPKATTTTRTTKQEMTKSCKRKSPKKEAKRLNKKAPLVEKNTEKRPVPDVSLSLTAPQANIQVATSPSFPATTYILTPCKLPTWNPVVNIISAKPSVPASNEYRKLPIYPIRKPLPPKVKKRRKRRKKSTILAEEVQKSSSPEEKSSENKGVDSNSSSGSEKENLILPDASCTKEIRSLQPEHEKDEATSTDSNTVQEVETSLLDSDQHVTFHSVPIEDNQSQQIAQSDDLNLTMNLDVAAVVEITTEAEDHQKDLRGERSGEPLVQDMEGQCTSATFIEASKEMEKAKQHQETPTNITNVKENYNLPHSSVNTESNLLSSKPNVESGHIESKKSMEDLEKSAVPSRKNDASHSAKNHEGASLRSKTLQLPGQPVQCNATEVAGQSSAVPVAKIASKIQEKSSIVQESVAISCSNVSNDVLIRSEENARSGYRSNDEKTYCKEQRDDGNCRNSIEIPEDPEPEIIGTDKISECIARSMDLIDAQDGELMDLGADWADATGSPKSPMSPTQMFLNMFPLLPRDGISMPPVTPVSESLNIKEKSSMSYQSSNRASFLINSMLPDENVGGRQDATSLVHLSANPSTSSSNIFQNVQPIQQDPKKPGKVTSKLPSSSDIGLGTPAKLSSSTISSSTAASAQTNNSSNLFELGLHRSYDSQSGISLATSGVTAVSGPKPAPSIDFPSLLEFANIDSSHSQVSRPSNVPTLCQEASDINTYSQSQNQMQFFRPIFSPALESHGTLGYQPSNSYWDQNHFDLNLFSCNDSTPSSTMTSKQYQSTESSLSETSVPTKQADRGSSNNFHFEPPQAHPKPSRERPAKEQSIESNAKKTQSSSSSGTGNPAPSKETKKSSSPQKSKSKGPHNQLASSSRQKNGSSSNGSKRTDARYRAVAENVASSGSVSNSYPQVMTEEQASRKSIPSSSSIPSSIPDFRYSFDSCTHYTNPSLPISNTDFSDRGRNSQCQHRAPFKNHSEPYSMNTSITSSNNDKNMQQRASHDSSLSKHPMPQCQQTNPTPVGDFPFTQTYMMENQYHSSHYYQFSNPYYYNNNMDNQQQQSYTGGVTNTHNLNNMSSGSTYHAQPPSTNVSYASSSYIGTESTTQFSQPFNFVNETSEDARLMEKRQGRRDKPTRHSQSVTNTYVRSPSHGTSSEGQLRANRRNVQCSNKDTTKDVSSAPVNWMTDQSCRKNSTHGPSKNSFSVSKLVEAPSQNPCVGSRSYDQTSKAYFKPSTYPSEPYDPNAYKLQNNAVINKTNEHGEHGHSSQKLHQHSNYEDLFQTKQSHRSRQSEYNAGGSIDSVPIPSSTPYMPSFREENTDKTNNHYGYNHGDNLLGQTPSYQYSQDRSSFHRSPSGLYPPTHSICGSNTSSVSNFYVSTIFPEINDKRSMSNIPSGGHPHGRTGGNSLSTTNPPPGPLASSTNTSSEHNSVNYYPKAPNPQAR